MAKKPDPPKPRFSVKAVNRITLATIVATNIAVFTVFLTSNTLGFPKLEPSLGMLSSAGPASLAAIIAALFADQFSPTLKARLVYLKWRHPLPGCRAFSVYAPENLRVDPAKLRRTIGELPTDPDEQNRTWYGLYKNVRTEPSVVEANTQYLLYRDYTTIALFLLIILPTAAVLKNHFGQLTALYTSALAAQFFLAQNAARRNGERLVANVLAETTHPKP